MPAEVTVVEETIARNKRRLAFAAVSASLGLSIIFMLHVLYFFILITWLSPIFSLTLMILSDILLMALLSFLVQKPKAEPSAQEEIARDHISSQIKWSLLAAGATGAFSIAKFFFRKPNKK